MIKFTGIPKKKPIWYLAIWQNWWFGQSYHSKWKSKHLVGLSFPGDSFFEGTRENILHIFWTLVMSVGVSNLLGPKKQGFLSKIHCS